MTRFNGPSLLVGLSRGLRHERHAGRVAGACAADRCSCPKISARRRERGPRLGTNPNFDVRVGTRIPRSVRYAALPPDIVRIIPQYRGFVYFLVEDQIVIVDPHTLEIVAVIPA